VKKSLAQYSDKELVAMLRSGKKESEAAFAEIYDRYSLKINAYCMTILGNRELAEDVFQDTFVRFFHNAQHNWSGSIVGFLITIARNLCLNAKRDRKTTIPIEELDLPVLSESSYEDREVSELIMTALDLLEHDFKEALILRYFDDLRYKDIGDILGITEARARYLVFTGKQKLKAIMQPYLKGVYK
jgi:RNA polymerase sigma factor (sigma-70 family)